MSFCNILQPYVQVYLKPCCFSQPLFFVNILCNFIVNGKRWKLTKGNATYELGCSHVFLNFFILKILCIFFSFYKHLKGLQYLFSEYTCEERQIQILT